MVRASGTRDVQAPETSRKKVLCFVLLLKEHDEAGETGAPPGNDRRRRRPNSSVSSVHRFYLPSVWIQQCKKPQQTGSNQRGHTFPEGEQMDDLRKWWRVFPASANGLLMVPKSRGLEV